MSISEKLTTIAESLPEVYDAGKKSWNNEMWKAITNSGERTDYNYFFTNTRFNKNNFFPTYDIKPTGVTEMFKGIPPASVDEQVDMEELENKMGIVFDFSKCTSFRMCFAGGLFKTLNIIDMTKASGDNAYAFYGAYAGCKLTRINRLICSEITSFHTTTFQHTDLEYIGFEGIIAKNIDVSSPWRLNKDSLIKLINTLSPEHSGLTVTIRKLSIKNAFGIDIDDETTYPEGSEYYNLRNSKSNWTFNYI